jgi:hypothetical protein
MQNDCDSIVHGEMRNTQEGPTWRQQTCRRMISAHSHCKPSRPELKAVQLTFLNCEDVKPSVRIFINGQYLVEKSLIY